VTRSVVLELARASWASAWSSAVHGRGGEGGRARRSSPAPTRWSCPVTSIDGQPVANGRPGSVTERLLGAYAARSGLELSRRTDAQRH
jgi:hypothetical protein